MPKPEQWTYMLQRWAIKNRVGGSDTTFREYRHRELISAWIQCVKTGCTEVEHYDQICALLAAGREDLARDVITEAISRMSSSDEPAQ